MGHLVGKALFRKLGRKIDGLETRAPWNDKLYAVLKELYTEEEANVVIKMHDFHYLWRCGNCVLGEDRNQVFIPIKFQALNREKRNG